MRKWCDRGEVWTITCGAVTDCVVSSGPSPTLVLAFIKDRSRFVVADIAGMNCHSFLAVVEL
jgi:hypothetical protein